jgi:hypothetical protein
LQSLLKAIEEGLCKHLYVAVRGDGSHQDSDPPNALWPFGGSGKWPQGHQRAKEHNEGPSPHSIISTVTDVQVPVRRNDAIMPRHPVAVRSFT